MFLEAFTDELINGPCRGPLVKVALSAERLLLERLIAAGAVSGMAGKALQKAHHGWTKGPYDPPVRGSILGAGGWGGAGGALAALILNAASKGKVRS